MIGRVFRVFLSSTFKEFAVEREVLHDRVWPEIRAYCIDRGARFQLIDLRWGISEEASQDQRTTTICLEEIRRCQEVSPDFSFIALVGDQFGSRLLPESIPAPDFDRMLSTLRHRNQRLLRHWYRLDNNALPDGEYVLLPRGGPAAVDQGRYAQFAVWQPLQERLLAILARACQASEVSATTHFAILSSVTERELQAGIFDAADPGAAALCFHRIAERRHWPILRNSPQSSISGQPRWASVIERLSALPRESVIPYTAPAGHTERTQDHLLGFCDLVEQRVKARIDHVLSERQERGGEAPDDTHRRFARDRLRHFVGREEALGVITAHLAADSSSPLLVTGPSGVGKTAVLLAALAQAETTYSRQDTNPVILHRFIGGSTAVNDLIRLLRDLCQTLVTRYSASQRPLPATQEELIRRFPQFLGLATEDRPLVLFLDAVDQLRDTGEDLAWLPTKLPSHVHLVFSALAGPAVARWREAHPRLSVVDLAPLNRTSIEEALAGVMRDAGRELRPEQHERLLARCISSGIPLYLRLAGDQARSWRSWQVGGELPEMATDVPGLLQTRLRELEAPAAHGQVLVEHALGLLGAAKDGLAEDELLAVLSRDPRTRDAIVQRTPHAPKVAQVPVVLWSRLHADLEPLLTEREQDSMRLIGFYHREIGDVIGARYLTGEAKFARHRDLAHYFSRASGQTPYLVNTSERPHALINGRMVSELAFQQHEGQLRAQLSATVFDAEFLQARIQRGSTSDAVADLGYIDEGDDVRLLMQTLKLSSHVLDVTPEEMPNQILGRAGRDAYHRLHHWPSTTTPHLRLDSETLSRAGAELLRMFSLDGAINNCVFSADGRHLLSDCTFDTFNTLLLWDVDSGALLRTFQGHTGFIYSFEFSPDESRILSASQDHTLRLWDVQTGECLHIYEGHSNFINACTFSPDGRHALSASLDHTLRLWDVQTGECLHTLEGHTGDIRVCTFSPNGRQALSGSWDNTLRLWDVQTGQCLHTLEGHTELINACMFDADGKYVVSASKDSTLRLWDAATGQAVRVFQGHTDMVNACALSPDGRSLLSASDDKTLRLWDLQSGKSLYTFEGHTGWIGVCALSPDGRYAVSGSEDATVRLWDVKTGEAVRTLEGHAGPVNVCVFNPDGQSVVSGSDDRTLRLWSVHTETPLHAHPYQGHTELIRACAYSPDGTFALSASDDSTLRLWDAATTQTLRIFRGHTNWVLSCAFSPDGKRILSGSRDGSLRLWEVKTGECLHVMGGYMGFVLSCAFSPDGQYALSASDDKALRLWDLQTGVELRRFRHDAGFASACAYSPDGRYALSASEDRNLYLWDLQTGALLRTFEGHTEWVRACTFSPDGKYALSASRDFTLRLWDVRTGESVRTFAGHTSYVHVCAFSPDGRYAFSASTDSTLRLWDVQTGTQLLRWLGDNPMTSLALTADWQHAVAGEERVLHFITVMNLPMVGRTEAVHVVDAFMDGLHDADVNVRKQVVQALRTMGSPRGVRPLVAALRDDDTAVRRAAAEALGEIQDVQAVEPLIAALADTEREVQVSAVKALRTLRDRRAVAPLISLLTSNTDNGAVRREAAEALGDLRDPRVVEPLITALTDSDPSVRRVAAQTLKAFASAAGPRGVGPLVVALRDDDTAVRRAAAEALGEIQDVQAEEPLIAALADTEREVQVSAVKALRALRDRRAVAPLIAILLDSNRQAAVRGVAAEALGDLHDARAVEPLIDILKQGDLREYSRGYFGGWILLRRTAEALGKLGDPRAAEPLLAALKDMGWRYRKSGGGFIETEEQEIQAAASDALVAIKDPDTVDPLLELFENTAEKREVRALAARTLSQMKVARAAEPFIAALTGTDEYMRAIGAAALGRLKHAQAVELLITALKDVDAYVRSQAAWALGEIEDARAVEPLIAILNDGEEKDGTWLPAARALSAIRDARAVEPLIELLADSDTEVRRVAARALREFQDERAVEPLLAAFNDHDNEVRGLAAWALGTHHDPRAAGPLMAALADPDSLMRGLAARALGELKDAQAVRPLIKALDDLAAEVCEQAKWALEQIGTPEAVAALAERLLL